MGRLINPHKYMNRRQTGFTLIENLVAVAILAAIGVVFMNALLTGYSNVGILSESQTAEILIRSQLESIKSGPFQATGVYPVTVDLPPHYSVSINATSPTCIGQADDCVPLSELVTQDPFATIHEISVTVYHDHKPIISVACFKAIQ